MHQQAGVNMCDIMQAIQVNQKRWKGHASQHTLVAKQVADSALIPAGVLLHCQSQ